MSSLTWGGGVMDDVHVPSTIDIDESTVNRRRPAENAALPPWQEAPEIDSEDLADSIGIADTSLSPALAWSEPFQSLLSLLTEGAVLEFSAEEIDRFEAPRHSGGQMEGESPEGVVRRLAYLIAKHVEETSDRCDGLAPIQGDKYISVLLTSLSSYVAAALQPPTLRQFNYSIHASLSSAVLSHVGLPPESVVMWPGSSSMRLIGVVREALAASSPSMTYSVFEQSPPCFYVSADRPSDASALCSALRFLGMPDTCVVPVTGRRSIHPGRSGGHGGSQSAIVRVGSNSNRHGGHVHVDRYADPDGEDEDDDETTRQSTNTDDDESGYSSDEEQGGNGHRGNGGDAGENGNDDAFDYADDGDAGTVDARMDAEALAAAIDADVAAGRRPVLCLVRSGGSPGSAPGLGQLDNIDPLLHVCRARRVWSHVAGVGPMLWTVPHLMTAQADSFDLDAAPFLGEVSPSGVAFRTGTTAWRDMPVDDDASTADAAVLRLYARMAALGTQGLSDRCSAVLSAMTESMITAASYAGTCTALGRSAVSMIARRDALGSHGGDTCGPLGDHLVMMHITREMANNATGGASGMAGLADRLAESQGASLVSIHAELAAGSGALPGGALPGSTGRRSRRRLLKRLAAAAAAGSIPSVEVVSPSVVQDEENGEISFDTFSTVLAVGVGSGSGDERGRAQRLVAERVGAVFAEVYASEGASPPVVARYPAGDGYGHAVLTAYVPLAIPPSITALTSAISLAAASEWRRWWLTSTAAHAIDTSILRVVDLSDTHPDVVVTVSLSRAFVKKCWAVDRAAHLRDIRAAAAAANDGSSSSSSSSNSGSESGPDSTHGSQHHTGNQQHPPRTYKHHLTLSLLRSALFAPFQLAALPERSRANVVHSPGGKGSGKGGSQPLFGVSLAFKGVFDNFNGSPPAPQELLSRLATEVRRARDAEIDVRRAIVDAEERVKPGWLWGAESVVFRFA